MFLFQSGKSNESVRLNAFSVRCVVVQMWRGVKIIRVFPAFTPVRPRALRSAVRRAPQTASQGNDESSVISFRGGGGIVANSSSVMNINSNYCAALGFLLWLRWCSVRLNATLWSVTLCILLFIKFAFLSFVCLPKSCTWKIIILLIFCLAWIFLPVFSENIFWKL